MSPFQETGFNSETRKDNLVSATQGEADESTPAVFIGDAPTVFIDVGADIPQILREVFRTMGRPAMTARWFGVSVTPPSFYILFRRRIVKL